MSIVQTLSEAQIQTQIIDYLAARHILAFRMNTGAMVSEYKERKRFMRFGVPGMADVLAFVMERSFPSYFTCATFDAPRPLWIEVKSATGKQSELQKSFQRQVEGYGHTYILARSLEDVKNAL